MRIMELDFPWLEMLEGLIKEVSETFELDPAIVAAVVSRESGAGRLLGKNGCPPDTGDRGHGRGLMQIDDRWHDAFLSIGDLWRNPAANLAYGCYLLRKNLEAVRERCPDLSDKDRLHMALAGYNCGLSRALRALRQGHPFDYYTTGRDYGEDVLARAEWLRGRNW
ncbi:MAG: transglycosylase SLT domain-containing protein [bacterium]